MHAADKGPQEKIESGLANFRKHLVKRLGEDAVAEIDESVTEQGGAEQEHKETS